MFRSRLIFVLVLFVAAAFAGCSDDGGEPTDEPPARLDPASIPKYVAPLVVPPEMPYESREDGVTEYRIAVRQFDQQVLPDSYPKTTVFGYGAVSEPSTFHFPAYTIETRTDETVRVEWINDLVDEEGNYVPHLLDVDQTLHWANPLGQPDTHGTSQDPYEGPVPVVVHLHGGHTPSVSDGYPEAWWLPDAKNLPEGASIHGSNYGSVEQADDGTALFEYFNDQRAATLWYHDHAMGITRLNVYSGMAGFYLIRDAEDDALDLPAPAPSLDEAEGTRHYEIPIAIQDRTFNEDGSLFYPKSRVFFDGYEGPYAPEAEPNPIWNPEFFGDAMVVNGRTWPYLEVEPRLYRFRLLNGSNSRFLVLKNDDERPFHQIGSDGGLLSDVPAERTELLLGPAERADVLVDFSDLQPGDEVIMQNVGPDEPFGGLDAAQEPADPETTGQIMQFRVVAGSDDGVRGSIPESLPTIDRLVANAPARELTLNEEMAPNADIPIEAELGTREMGPRDWDDEVTELVRQGDTEEWRMINLTGDAHPMHLHLVMFQVIDRQPFDADAYADAQSAALDVGEPVPSVEDFYTGAAIPPAPGESGWKDTVVANPGEVTRVIATFDMAGLYVWHCHILEHEDNEMMRDLIVQ